MGELGPKNAVALVCALVAAAGAVGCYQQQEAFVPGHGETAGDTATDSDVDGDTDGDGDADGDSDGDGDADSDTGTGAEPCADVGVDYDPINMLIVLDRSRSMFTNTIATETYAEVVADALEGLAEELIDDDLANFGLAVFPSLLCEDGDMNSEHECTPASDSDNPVVEVGSDNHAEIDLALDVVGQCGGTPLCSSLEWALDYLTGETFPDELDELPKYVLLATDGEPNCNPDADFETCTCSADTCVEPEQCLDDLCTYNAALQLAAAGIAVFVVGVGDDIAEWDYVMNNIALYGGTNEYFPVQGADSLQDALEEIAGSAVGCEFGMDWTAVPADVETGCDRVALEAYDEGLLDWVELPRTPSCSDPSGWRWEGEPPALDETVENLSLCSRIVLCEEACESLTEGAYSDFRAHVGHQVEPVD